jgi:molybdopterin/thiamine biosynthesis adenylyltransferase
VDLDRFSALVVGAGALGSSAAAGLAASGVARLGVVDPEHAEPVARRLGGLHPRTIAEPYPALLERANAAAIVAGHDVVIECTNDGAARLAANDACLVLGVPLVAAGTGGWRGWLTCVRPGESACLHCAAAELLEPGEGSVPAPLAAAVGSLAALEAGKLLRGDGVPLLDRVLVLDALAQSARELQTRRRADCPSCALVGAAV